MAKKCRKCRDEKKLASAKERSPARPPSGSIRKAKRLEMRAAKKRRLAAEEPHQLPVEFSGGETISQSVVSVIQLDVESLT